METIIPNWKSDIVLQLKTHTHQQNGYEHLIRHCRIPFARECFHTSLGFFVVDIDARLLENNLVLKNQCQSFERNVSQLRLANAGLEKASEAR